MPWRQPAPRWWQWPPQRDKGSGQGSGQGLGLGLGLVLARHLITLAPEKL